MRTITSLNMFDQMSMYCFDSEGIAAQLWLKKILISKMFEKIYIRSFINLL